ncbi:hypothetical protein PFISCL1PPCAC_5868, partial [Pristionchus fissidentatus]
TPLSPPLCPLLSNSVCAMLHDDSGRVPSSVSEDCGEVSASTVAFMLSSARMLGNAKKEDDCMRFLRAVSAPKLVGEMSYMTIGKEFEIDFIQERYSTMVIFASISNALITGLPVHRFRNIANCKFVDLLDDCKPVSPVGLKEITNRSILRVLRWAYKYDKLLVLKEYQSFLASHQGKLLFNDYQLLHMANRFDFPYIRREILSKIRTVEEYFAFRANENYRMQLSDVDREQFEVRGSYMRRGAEERVKLDDNFYSFDFHSGCTFEKSCAERFTELSKEEEDEIFEKEEDMYMSGFNSEITGISF